MKKLYLFFALLLGLTASSTLSAQEEFTKLKTIQIGEAVAEVEPDTWYFMYQGRNVDQNAGTYEFVRAGSLPESGQGGVLTDRGIGQQIFKMNVNNVIDPQPAADYAAYVVKFLPVDGKEGAYNIQFGTGRYMTPPTGTNNGSTFTTAESIYDAGEFNIYNIDPEDPGCMGFNVYEYAGRIDNNGTDHNVVVWGSGKHEAIETTNSIWSVHEVVWGEGDEYEIAMSDLSATADEYETRLDAQEWPCGDGIGEYNEEKLKAFMAAIEAARAADTPGEELPIEELARLKQAIIDSFEALQASKVPYFLADGYYRIRSAMVYTNNVPIGETDEDGNPITEATNLYKYMYSTISGGKIVARWNTPDDLDSDCPSLWKITKSGDNYDIVSCATDARFKNVVTSTAVEMSTDSENLMALEHVANVDEESYVHIRVATQEANRRFYLHQDGHNGGNGVQGNIVGWENTFANGSPGASEWVFEPVSDEDAATIIEGYAPIKDHDLMVDNYKTMKADALAKLEVAKDISVNTYDDQPLITDAAQLSSPWTEPSEGSIEALLDGDATTFWHSNWSDGTVEQHKHYLQVALNDATHQLVAMRFTRRPVASDHITRWGVFGSDNPEAADEEWTELTSISTPYTNNTETLTSNLFDIQGKQYLRFYADATTTNRGYWHISEFQLYPGEVINPATSQYNVMGTLATNLEQVIKAQEGIEEADLSPENYMELKQAYDDFIAKYVNPADLRAQIDSALVATEGIVPGTQPGFWASADVANTLKATVATAKAYDEAGDYTPAQSEAYIETLRTQRNALMPAAIGIRTDKWYRIRFATEEEFEKYNWDKVGGNGQTATRDEVEYMLSEPLFGKYVTAATVEGSQPVSGITQYEIIPMQEVEEAMVGTNLFLDELEDVHQADLALFRFVAVGDSGYVLQNKGSNLFVKAAGTSGAVTLSAHPSLFNVRAIGYGLNVLAAKALTDGAAQSYLHGQVAQNIMVTWNVDYPGSRSGLYIEEVADVEADYTGTDFNLGMQEGTLGMYCFPVDIKAANGLYSIAKIEGTDVTLAPLTEVPAGHPFICINGDLEAYAPEDADFIEPVQLSHGYAFNTTPDTLSVFKGTYSPVIVGQGAIIPEGNQLVVTKRSNTTVQANRAYISGAEKFDPEATVTFTIEANGQDGINAALATVARSSELYTIDGRLIKRHANLNSLKNMPKGIYLLGGTKVTVK